MLWVGEFTAEPRLKVRSEELWSGLVPDSQLCGTAAIVAAGFFYHYIFPPKLHGQFSFQNLPFMFVRSEN